MGTSSTRVDLEAGGSPGRFQGLGGLSPSFYATSNGPERSSTFQLYLGQRREAFRAISPIFLEASDEDD